jgi:hypothetical protein
MLEEMDAKVQKAEEKDLFIERMLNAVKNATPTLNVPVVAEAEQHAPVPSPELPAMEALSPEPEPEAEQPSPVPSPELPAMEALSPEPEPEAVPQPTPSTNNGFAFGHGVDPVMVIKYFNSGTLRAMGANQLKQFAKTSEQVNAVFHGGIDRFYKKPMVAFVVGKSVFDDELPSIHYFAGHSTNGGKRVYCNVGGGSIEMTKKNQGEDCEVRPII